MNVSVIIPTRNRCELLSTTLRSVLRQRDVEFEVFVVDEGSTDETPAMLRSLDDPRVRVIRHDVPLGVSTARNRGAFEARGDWLAFVDDDDIWAPEKLAAQLQAADTAGRDWAYAGAVNIAHGGQIVSGKPPLPPDAVVMALERYNAIPGGGSNVVVLRRAWMDAGPFDIRLRNTEDWEMWIRLARRRGPPAWVCSPMVGYRVHSFNSALDVEEVIRGARLIEELHHTRADWGRLHRWFAESCLRTGDRTGAAAHFARAAAHGEFTGVLADSLTVLRRAVARYVPRAHESPAGASDSWLASATPWVREFEYSLPADRSAV
jgi:glycosyltransferase involved in cell wall biosynthesis